ncbi:MAG: hypothetical protein R3C61_28920 [Bacteroidia bacterium]
MNVSAYSSLPEGCYILEKEFHSDQWETILQGNWDREITPFRSQIPILCGLCLYRLRQTLDVREVQISNQVKLLCLSCIIFVHTNESGYGLGLCEQEAKHHYAGAL